MGLECRCVRCGHFWFAQTEVKPERCAGCKKWYWWLERRTPRPATEQSERLGRPALYPQLAALVPGSECLIPWRELPNGQPDNKSNMKHRPAALAHAKRHGWRVRTEPRSKGLAVVRLA